MADYSTALSAFENKEADAVMMALGPEDAKAAESSEFLKISMKPATGYDLEHLLITAFKPMEDVNVRRAIAMAIDKQALVDVLGGGQGQTGYTKLDYHHIPFSVPTCNEQFAKVVPLKYDPEAAKAELAKSPYAETIKDMELNTTLGMWGEPVLHEPGADASHPEDAEGQPGDQPDHPPGADGRLHQAHLPDAYVAELAGRAHDGRVHIHEQPRPALAAAAADEKQMTMLNLPYVPELVAKMKEAGEQTDPVKMCEKLAEAQQLWVDNVFTLDLFVGTTYRLQAPWVQNLNLYGPARPSISQLDGHDIAETVILKH